jgi:hypothetical protein
MHQVRRGRTHAGLAVTLGTVERAPLGAAVDRVLIHDEPAVVADDLTALAVGDQPLGGALRTAVPVGLLLAGVVSSARASRQRVEGGCSSSGRVGRIRLMMMAVDRSVDVIYINNPGRLKSVVNVRSQ